MKKVVICVTLSIIVAACASQESRNYIRSTELLTDNCKETFIKTAVGSPTSAAAVSPIVYYSGKVFQACAMAESGVLRSKQSRMEYALSICETQRANAMKKYRGLVLQPCRPFMAQDKKLWR